MQIKQPIRASLIATAILSLTGTQASAEQPATLYKNVTVIDGTGTTPKDNMNILVENGRIASLGPVADIKAPDGAAIIDSTGLYALPGLIDTHVHLTTVPDLEKARNIMRRHVYSGITTVRDMAGDMRPLAELARESRLGKIPAPDLYYAAVMAGPSFFHDPRPGASAEGEVAGQVPWMQAITPDTNMPEAVALARGTWASGIKIYANLPREAVHRIGREARQQGIKTWAHSMVFPATPQDVLDAGIDVVSHVCRLAWQLAENRPDEYHHNMELPYDRLDAHNPRLTALFDQMKSQGTILDATLWLYSYLEERRKKQAGKKPGPAACPPAFAASLTQAGYRRGVDISAGTDVIMPEGASYPALFHELEALVNDAGIRPLDAIRSATFVGARAIGIEADTGTLAAGKKADILFVGANPAEDIRNLRNIVLTVKAGIPYAREDFAPAGDNGSGENE